MSRRRGRRTGRAATAVLLLTAMLLMAGCSSTGGRRAENAEATAEATTGGGGGGGGSAAGTGADGYTVAMVTHSGDGDTYWDIVRSGAEVAAEKDDINFLYSHHSDAGQQAQLVQAAIDQGVDGLIVTLAKPEAMEDVVRRAVAAGIPVITVNSGQDVSAGYGALAHIGQDEVLAGEAVGEELNARGAAKAVCLFHEQGNVGHEQRCDGVRNTFDGTVEYLYADGANMPALESTLEAQLITDPALDTVITLGAPYAAVAAKSAEQAGSDAEIVTFDLNAQVAVGLRDGTIAFAVDQQPYLQGYESVDLLWLHLTNGNMLGGGQPVLTGPQIVTPDEAEALIEYAQRGTR
ncbi:sugar ABC transporter substrate-binding protein [Streptomyces sp. NPDC059853]|uniref:sugar ABC transporter substrate-binding protein n=1 Tax=Streptomyces sp. NPDC059853 TaxID=3346973 RepID=UPI00364786C4